MVRTLPLSQPAPEEAVQSDDYLESLLKVAQAAFAVSRLELGDHMKGKTFEVFDDLDTALLKLEESGWEPD